MHDYVDELSTALIDRYKLYVQNLMVDFCSENGLIEFRFGYSLRRDSRLQTRTFRIGTAEGLTDDERRIIVDTLFEEIEKQIDESISGRVLELN